MIDVGGPSMLRAAAKNYASVTPVCRPEDYDAVLGELRDERRRPRSRPRRGSRAIAFARSAAYEAAIARWFQRDEGVPGDRSCPRSTACSSSRTARTRTSSAAYYAERGARTHLLSRVEQLQGKQLSFNNLNDLSAARLLVRELDEPACVDRQAREPVRGRRRRDDRGGVRNGRSPPTRSRRTAASSSLNRAVTAALGELLGRPVRRGAVRARLRRAGARGARRGSRRSRVLERHRAPRASTTRSATTAACSAASSSRTATGRSPGATAWRSCAARSPRRSGTTSCSRGASCKHVTSNAIVLAQDGQTIGIGAGQMSRVDAVRIALEKARELGHSLDGAVLASDAFFPFADGPQLALDAGVVRARPAGRLEARRRGDRGGVEPPARRWSSPTAATSGTEQLQGRNTGRRDPSARQPGQVQVVTCRPRPAS